MVVDRPIDFGTGAVTDRCEIVDVRSIYGPRNSARTEWTRRLDLGAGRRWTDGRGWNWDLSFSLLNALFDPTGVSRPATESRDPFVGCDAPVRVVRTPETVLPPIPSLSIRVSF